MAPELCSPWGVAILATLVLLLASLFIPSGVIMPQALKSRLVTLALSVAALILVLIALFAAAVVNYGSFDVAWQATLEYPAQLWVSIKIGGLVAVLIFFAFLFWRASRRMPDISA